MAQVPFSIDLDIPDELLAEFAGQLDHLDDKQVLVDYLRQHFRGDKSNEFYEGLVAGYAAAHSILRENRDIEHAAQTLGRTLAFVSAEVLRHRIQHQRT